MHPETKYILPSPPLRPYIQSYWTWVIPEDFNSVTLPTIFPDLQHEMIIYDRSDRVLIRQNGTEFSVPEAHMAGYRSGPINMALRGHVSFIGIRFYPGAVRQFTDVSMEATTDSYESITGIFGVGSKDLTGRVQDATEIHEKIAILNDWFLKRLHATDNPLHPKLPVHDPELLVRSNYFSERHLRRIFRELYGVSPGRSIRTSRFIATFRNLVKMDRKYIDVANSFGYYDQSHFIKEFKMFSGMTPGEIVAGRAQLAEFYNTTPPGTINLKGNEPVIQVSADL